MTQEEFHKRYQYNPASDLLGEGGFGKVFKAYDKHLDKSVAIKVAEVKAGLEHVRLKHEVEIVNKLPTHPNIARYEECYTFSSFTGEYDFAVLQYYEEGNLQQLIESGKLNDKQKSSILGQILEGIDFLHSHEIIHRDLKPQNILIANRNGEYIPKITDFGISKKLNTTQSTAFTNSISGIGSVAFSSPEQLKGAQLKKNTDLWSYGIIVCKVLLNRLPFDIKESSITNEEDRIKLYQQITLGNFSIINSLPDTWIELVKQCLITDNSLRIKNASDCFQLLGIDGNEKEKSEVTENLETQIQVDSSGNSIKKWIQHHWKLTTLISLGMLVVLVAFLLINYFGTLKYNDKIITDIDGNQYHTVTIGKQEWLAENLKVTRLNDGSPIANIKDNDQWIVSSQPAYCWFNHQIKYKNFYGGLYNLNAVKTNKLVPVGWHVPTQKEWQELVDYIQKIYHKTPADFELKGKPFLPMAGCRSNIDGSLSNLNSSGYYWSSTISGQGAFDLSFEKVSVDPFYVDQSPNGYSIRCIKNK